jgi:hypothetical protein
MVPSLLCIFLLAQCLFKYNNPLVEYAKDTPFVDGREFGRWTIIRHPHLLGRKLHDLLRPSVTQQLHIQNVFYNMDSFGKHT